jgi:hypothetical protein
MTKPPTLVRPDTSVFDVLEVRWAASAAPKLPPTAALGLLRGRARCASLARASAAPAVLFVPRTFGARVARAVAWS